MADTVLVVDSSKLVADLLKMRLEIHGYRVQRAQTGEEALALIAAQTPRLLVLDEQIDGIVDSRELCRRVRANAMWDTLPILMLTSSDDPQDASDRVAGANSYVNKDADLLSLPYRIKHMLERE